MSTFDADYIIAKMLADIPILSSLPQNSINLLIDDNETDSKKIYIQVADKIFQAA